MLKFLEWWSVRVNRHFCAVSQVQCAYFREQYGINVCYIPSGTVVKSPRPAQAILALGLEPHKYILFASRLVREKGAHYLIDAYRRLKTSTKLVIAGGAPGVDAYQRELFACADGDPRILFPGFVEGNLLEELFSNACFYVQPSDIEGLSIALLDALGYGLNCLVSDIPENIEAIDTHGFIFRRGDVDDLVAKMQMILDTDCDVNCSDSAQSHVQNLYSWDHVTDEFERYYEEVLGNKSCVTTIEVTRDVKYTEEP